MDNLKFNAINLRNKNPDAIIILGFKNADQITLIVASNQYNSNDIISKILSANEGNGGGNAIFAQVVVNIMKISIVS